MASNSAQSSCGLVSHRHRPYRACPPQASIQHGIKRVHMGTDSNLHSLKNRQAILNGYSIAIITYRQCSALLARGNNYLQISAALWEGRTEHLEDS